MLTKIFLFGLIGELLLVMEAMDSWRFFMLVIKVDIQDIREF
jgi:hypothetical protein